MIKCVHSGSWDFGDRVLTRLKVASTGIRGDDRRQLIKRAGEEFAHEIMRMELPADELPLHFIALGCTEMYGHNRNADGFRKRACRLYHDTFRKRAKYFLHHRNRPTDKSYGYIKASHFNEEMGRVELLVMLNKTASAAARNGGYIDHEGLQKIAAGEDIPGSMSCEIPYDECEICHKKAKTRKEYCGAECPGGGCRTKLGQLAADGSGRINAVDNPDPSWFDYSRVGQNADHTAFGSLIQKAASTGGVVGGAELAEIMGAYAPLALELDPNDPFTGNNRVKLARTAHKMATYEEESRRRGDFRLAAAATLADRDFYVKSGWKALADYRVLPPLIDYLESQVGFDKAASLALRVVERWPGVYTRLLSSDALAKAAATNHLGLADGSPAPESAQRDAWAVGHRYSLEPTHLTHRVHAEVGRALASKQAAATPLSPVSSIGDDAAAEEWALKFAAVRVLAAARTCGGPDEDEFLRAAVREE